jgi:hypothetical protein
LPLAGSGLSSPTAADYVASTVSIPHASNQLLAGQSWNNLYIDLYNSSSASQLAGLLYYGNTHSAGWSQLVRFTPSGL